jgi:hypothetical protein
VQRLCASGQQVEYRELTDVGHLTIDDAADDDVVTWLTDRLSTQSTTGTCSIEAP